MENDLDRLIKFKPPQSSDVIITLILRRKQVRSGHKRFDIMRDLGMDTLLLMDDYLIKHQFYDDKYKDYQVFNHNDGARKRIISHLNKLPPAYNRIREYILNNDLDALSKASQSFYEEKLKRVLTQFIYHRLIEQRMFIDIFQIAEDMGTTTKGQSKIREELYELNLIKTVKLDLPSQVVILARKIGYRINGELEVVYSRYPILRRKKKFPVEIALVLVMHLRGRKIADTCKRVSREIPNLTSQQLNGMVKRTLKGR